MNIRNSRFANLLAIAVLAALAVAATITAQERRAPKQYQPDAAPSSSDPLTTNIIVAPGVDYRIGPSDVLEVLVDDAPEFSRRFRVSGDGAIAMPFIGRINAQSKTPEELARLIADKLRGDYLNNPMVSVTVLQINSRTYFLQGAVRRPGLYQVEGQPSLLKLITIAGGLAENYGSTAFIIREVKEGAGSPDQTATQATNVATATNAVNEKAAPGDAAAVPQPASAEAAKARYELFKVNVNGLLRGNFDQDIAISPGDIVHIPPTDVFFVAGEVKAPGSFPLKDGTTLRQAISLAQGATFQAAGSRTIIFREDPATGHRQEIAVDLPAIMNGKKSDVQVLANDIIIVPNSRLKSIGGTLLRAFGVNATRMPIAY
jgi:polysaccharide biosynthesis/export protein